MVHRQGGMTLLEVLAAIAVGTVLFIGLTDMIDVSLEDARGQQAAYHQSQMVAAAQKYITANYATLQGLVASGGVVSATVTDLGDFLPDGFNDQNSYRHNTCVLIRRGSSAEKLDALVVGYGGIEIPDKNIAAVAMNAGTGAGYIPSTDTGVARGPSWSLNTTPYRSGTCQGGAAPLTGGANDAGHLVSNIFYDGPGNVLTDFVYRDAVPGHPELNRMNVPLQMANAGLVTLGGACTGAALAIESTTKNVVVCDGGAWRYSSSSWKEPVASYGALASVSAADGDVRVTRNTGRAFVYNGGTATWNALAVDQNGDLDVPRDIMAARNIAASTLHTSGHIYTDSDINVGQNAIISGNVDARRDVNIARNLDVRQYLTAWGPLEAKEYIWIINDALYSDFVETGEVMFYDRKAPGQACNYPGGMSQYGWPVTIDPTGTTGIDAVGRLMTCSVDNTFRYQNGTYSPP